MPRNVPTRAAATFSPMASLGPPSAPIVSTTPSTAATMPNPGSASAMVFNAAMGLPDSACCTSRSISIMVSISIASTPPDTTMRSVSQRNCSA